jgi:hypothetical protein
MTLKYEALACARQGYRVFPLVPDGRAPLTAHGFHDATIDEAQIVAWWDQYPLANVGVATGKVSGIVVVDVARRRRHCIVTSAQPAADPRGEDATEGVSPDLQISRSR